MPQKPQSIPDFFPDPAANSTTPDFIPDPSQPTEFEQQNDTFLGRHNVLNAGLVGAGEGVGAAAKSPNRWENVKATAKGITEMAKFGPNEEEAAEPGGFGKGIGEVMAGRTPEELKQGVSDIWSGARGAIDRFASYIPGANWGGRFGKALIGGLYHSGGDVGEGLYRTATAQNDEQRQQAEEMAARGGGQLVGTTLGALIGAKEAPESLEGTQPVQEVLPPPKALPPGPTKALPPVTIEGEPVRTFIEPSQAPPMAGRQQILLRPPGPSGAPIELPGAPEDAGPTASPVTLPERTPRIFRSKPGAAEANPTVPRTIFGPKIADGEGLTEAERQELVQAQERKDQLPSWLQRQAGESAFGLPEQVAPPETNEVQQPKSDLSDVDRKELPGKVVDPRLLDVDWDSHPFVLPDDVNKMVERIQKGEQPTAIVHTKSDGRMEVIDGHGSAMAALKTGTPIKVTELANTDGAEAIGARAASHFLAKDKPEVTASIGDDTQKPILGQDVPVLKSLHERLRQDPSYVAGRGAGERSEPTNQPTVMQNWAMQKPEMGVIGERTAKPRTPGEPLELGFNPNPAPDLGLAARRATEASQGPMPRGGEERRLVPRTPEQEQTQRLFGQARKELGDQTDTDTIMRRVEQLRSGEKAPIKQIPATTTWRVDTRSGREFQVEPGTKPKANEMIISRDSEGREQVLARGAKAQENQPGLFGSERGSATPDFMRFLAGGGLSDFGKAIAAKVKEKMGDRAVNGWAELAPYLSEEDRTSVNRALQKKVISLIRGVDFRGVEEATKAGSLQRGWYQRTAQMLNHLFGDDTRTFAHVMAQLSPMKSVELNFTHALDFYSDWVEAGRPRDAATVQQLIAKRYPEWGVARQGMDKGIQGILVNGREASGPKVSNFARNLLGEVNGVTKDRLMAYLFGYQDVAYKQRAYRLATDIAVRATAKKLGITPSEAQESAWSFVRGVLSFSDKRGVTPREAARQITGPDIKSGAAEFAHVIATNPKIGAALDRLADRTGDERFRVSSIQSSPEYQRVLAQQRGTRGVGGGLAGSSRNILGRVSERAAEARTESSKTVAQALKKRGAEAGFVTPGQLLDLANLPGAFWKKYVADPVLSKLGQGARYEKFQDDSPTFADLLKRRDSVVHAARLEGTAHMNEVLQQRIDPNAPPSPQEKLAFLMADETSRANLQRNHPAEYQQALRDPQVQGILRRYQPREQDLTAERAAFGGRNLPGDYIKRVYDQTNVSGKPFEKAVQLRDLPNGSRAATAEWHYQNGLHKFLDAYLPKFIAQKSIVMDKKIVDWMANNGTIHPKDQPLPNSIQFLGKLYYSPEQARAMNKPDLAYAAFDPLKYTKFKVGDNVILMPKEYVDAAAKEGKYAPVDYKPGKLKQAFQKGTIALGGGFPHAFANIPKRIITSYAGGYANPLGWAKAFRVALAPILDRSLMKRSEGGISDPTRPIDPRLLELARRGAARIDNEHSVGGGAPQNALLRKGHELIFKPGSWGGLGGVDIRARMDFADRLINQNPNMSWDKISERVERKFGMYTKENWTATQGRMAHVAPFPGWLYSTIRTGIEHPVRAGVSAAAAFYAINQTLYKMGMNRREDKDDISRIHVGNYALSPTVFNEPFAKMITMPALQAARPLIQGGSSREAIDNFVESATKSGGQSLNHVLLPYYSAPLEIWFNRPFAGTEREIYNENMSPREKVQAVLEHIGRRTIPQIGRMSPESESGLDIPSFLGSQVGLPMFRQDAETRLKRNLSYTSRADHLWNTAKNKHPDELQKLAETEPHLGLDLDFHSAFDQLNKMLREIDNATSVSPKDKPDLMRAREEVLKQADQLNDKYYELRDKMLEDFKKNKGAAPAPPPASAVPEALAAQ